MIAIIISHKHRFIFIKATKVAGTSIEVALARHCGDKDVVTPLSLSVEKDDKEYQHKSMNHDGFREHTTSKEIMRKEPNWQDYHKITCVRNPYDQVVSRYFWEMRKLGRKRKFKIMNPRFLYECKMREKMLRKGDFAGFVRFFRKYWTNEDFYFDESGNKICDTYLRFENLEGDFKRLCRNLDLPYVELPRTKTKSRKNKKHYSEFYDEKTKRIVEDMFQNTFREFKYRFHGETR